MPGKIEFETAAAPAKPGVTIFDLLNAVNVVLKRLAEKEAGTSEIYEDKWTVSEKIEFVLKTITERGRVRFAELFESAANRSEVVCTFLALLELIRLKQLVCVQPEPFAEIEISRAEQIVSPAKTPAATEPTAAVENNPQSPIPNP
jgi:segregation and condensation protein A